MNIKFNLDTRNIVIVTLLLLLLIGGYFHFNSNTKHKDQLIQEKNLRNALTDSVHTYQNKEHEWVSEKLTIQAETKDLKDKNLSLSANKTDLIKRVDEINKHNQIISAALIQLSVKLDGVVNNNPIIENDSTIQFTTKNDSIDYDIEIHNVKQHSIQIPKLEFKRFSLPNTQFIEFHFSKDKKEGYPISFSISNSNRFFKVNDIDSYTIPQINKQLVKPTFWNKLGTFSKSTGGKVLVFGLGVATGGLLINLTH